MMKRKPHSNRIRVYVYLLLIALIGISFVLVYNYVQMKSDTVITIESKIGTIDLEHDEICISIAKTQEWRGDNNFKGAEFKTTCTNKSGHDIHDWTVSMEVPEGSYIDSSWNGDYTIEDGILTYIPNSDNEIIFNNSERTFGFVLYTPFDYYAKNLQLSGCLQYKMEDIVWFWVLMLAFVAIIIGVITETVYTFRVRGYISKQKEDKRLIIQSMNTFINFIDAKDPYTRGHSARVAKYSAEIAKRMGKSQEEVDRLYYIALMHDVGKIGITDAVLNKPGRLTDEERRIIQTHTTIAETILKDFTALPNIIEGAKYHHERYGGKGYPTGIAGDEIPLCARIICIADSYDAMSSDRCYRKKLPADAIIDELQICSGSQFDPTLVHYMVEMIQDGFCGEYNSAE